MIHSMKQGLGLRTPQQESCPKGARIFKNGKFVAMGRYLSDFCPKTASRVRKELRQKSLFFVFFRRNPENPTIQSPKKMV